MNTKSVLEEILMALLWAGDKLARPTLNNLTEPFEAWERRWDLNRQLKRMEDRNLIVREKQAQKIVVRLTELGRLEALGGKDVLARWNRPWDGRWRQVLFDLPARQRRVRTQLWRWLRDNGFGYLQQSVWIHPDPVPEVVEALDKFREDVESFILMEATCCAGYSNAAVVNGAWDFKEINKQYDAYLETMKLMKAEMKRLVESPDNLGAWLRRERNAWQQALALDPLLPRALWPKDYRGEQAWQMRQAVLGAVAARFR